MTFEEIIKSFGEKVKVEIEIVDNMVTMEVDEMPVVISNIPQLESIVITGEMGIAPPENLEKLLSVLLEANYMFSGTNGATISRSPENGAFNLCQIIPLETLNDDKFFAAVETFINRLEIWRNIISDYRPQIEKTNDAPMEDVAGFMKI